MTDWPDHELDAEQLPGVGQAREFRVGTGDWPLRGIVLLRGDRYICFANVCPHRRHPLNLAVDDFLTPDGELLRCASHGAAFDPDTGECVAGPCIGARLTVLECRQENDSLLVTAPLSLRDL